MSEIDVQATSATAIKNVKEFLETGVFRESTRLSIEIVLMMAEAHYRRAEKQTGTSAHPPQHRDGEEG